MLNKLKWLVSVGLLITVMFLGSSCALGTEFLTLSSSDIGGTWFAEGATLTTQWNAEIPEALWSCDTRGGGTSNAYWMSMGRVDAALNNIFGLWTAIKGTGFFKDKGPQDFSNVYSMVALHNSFLLPIVKKDSDFEYLEDL